MSFRDDGDAQRHRVEALEREVESLRAERDRALAERDQARAANAPGYRVRQAVYVEWRGSWWDATVIEVVGPRAWRIHYDGWSSAWDEIVDDARILPRTGKPPAPYRGGTVRPLYFAAVMLLVVTGLALLVMLGHSRAPDAADEVPAGAPVSVEWHGTWYPATVLEALPDGSARIHYDGYSESFDETVPPSRVRPR